MVNQQATTATSGWKKIVANTDTISYVKQKQGHSIIIEARHYDTGWEIVKKYVGDDVNFTEQYSATSMDELKSLLKRLQGERELSQTEIKNLSQFKKKQLKLDIKRIYQERNVEKWSFAFNGAFSNSVIIHHGKTITVDITMEERLKYIEEKVVMKLFEAFGLDETERDTELTIYYYSKKTNYFFENEEEEVLLG
jgi:hypothetical protein